MNSYQDIVSYLESFLPSEQYHYPKEQGLERMKEFLRLLGNPHLAYPTVHVVGTAGKGSTATLLAHILTCGGYKTGLHISPHLQLIQERMQVNGQFASTAVLIKIIEEKIKPMDEVMKKGPFGPASYYEHYWALSFLYFRKTGVDIAVVEAGLGGTWDGTNALKPILGILTTVGLDHTEILGASVEEIAQDKVGVVRPHIPIVSGVAQKSVTAILKKRCQEEEAQVYLLNRDFSYFIKEINTKGTHFDFTMRDTNYSNIHLSLVGKHQVDNASLAIAAGLILRTYGFAISKQSIRQALETATMPGRLELVQSKPLVLLDGAHNPDKMYALSLALSLYRAKKKIGIVAFKKGKNIDAMLALLLPYLDHLIVTEFSVAIYAGRQGSMPVEEIIPIVQKLVTRHKLTITIESEARAMQAVEKGLKRAKAEDMILVTGSLYLIGEVRDRWYPRKKILTENSLIV